MKSHPSGEHHNAELKSASQTVQFKLNIGRHDDPFEHEADSMADNVMNMQSVPDIGASSTNGVQRKCAECQHEDEEKEKVQRKPSISTIQRKESGNATVANSAVTEGIASTRGSGSDMDNSTKDFMESGFGRDFSGVKIHTGSNSAEMNRELNAKAFTVGNDIYFNEGQYQPSSSDGKHLLAHELTHTIQQKSEDHTLQRSSLTDDEIDLEIEGDEDEMSGPSNLLAQTEDNKAAKPAKPAKQSPGGKCPWQKQSKVTHSDCATGGPADKSNYITSLDVKRAAQELTVTWKSGSTEKWLCSPNQTKTPLGPDKVGEKCSINHTNLKKDGMAWFTGFQKQGLLIGFHNSQIVAKGVQSHGCVRVSCDHAETINKNSWSGITKIHVDK